MPPDAARRARALTTFLAIAFGLGWASQGLVVGKLAGGITLADRAFLMAVVAPALMWPPAVAAFVARRWVEGQGFRDSGLRLGRPVYLLLGWLAPPLLVVVAAAASLPFAPFDPSFSTMRQILEQATAQAAAAGGTPPPTAALGPGTLVLVQAGAALTVGTALNTIFAFGEELGWRGYLLPRLVRELGTWKGTLLHGAIWGAWHAPLIAFAGHNYPGHPALGVLLFVAFGILFGGLLAWLTFASGSVLPATVAHAALNAVGGLPVLLLLPFDMAFTGVLWSVTGLALLAAVLGAMWLGGGLSRGLARGPEALGPPPAPGPAAPAG